MKASAGLEPAEDPRPSIRFMRLLCGSPLYGLLLSSRAPKDLAARLSERWAGTPLKGAALLSGEYRFGGELVRSDGAAPWSPADASAAWLAEMHSFAWLPDILAAGGDALLQGRRLIESWIYQEERWHPVTWRSDVLAQRLVTWLLHYGDLVAPPVGDSLREPLLRSMTRQMRHLSRVAGWEMAGESRLRALTGLVIAAASLGDDRRLDRALRRLDKELPLQILPDGGHISRSPSVQMAVLRYLVEARAAVRAAQVELPASLQMAIDRAAPLLRFFRHADGRLALFNGSTEEDAARIDSILTRAEAKGRPPASAPHLGFQRLQAGKVLVIVDGGRAPDDNRRAHAGALSFEMSQGRERLIVNCGAYRGPSAAWRQSTRATAAHSTLVVADTNSAEILPDGTLGRQPRQVTCERTQDENGQWIAMSHDGYQPAFGVTHARQLFLDADGDDLRGEDRLTGNAGESFTIRFHIHPSVQVSLTQNNAGALLRLPGGVGWRLRAQGAVMNLAESVYLGSGELKKAQQILLEGRVAQAGTTVKWAIRREARKAPDEGSGSA